MDKNNFVTLDDLTASDIRNVTPPGLMLSIREKQPSVLILDWEGQKYGLKLDGDDPFAFFPISAKTPHDGLFVSNVEILVDFNSRGNGRGRNEHGGVLVLEKDQLYVIGRPVGEDWLNGREVPLWPKIDGGSDSAKVAFGSWAIGVKMGDDYRILWSYEFEPNSD